MRKRGFTMLVLSLAMGLGAAWMANNWLEARTVAETQDNTHAVLAAAIDIPAGQLVMDRHVTAIEMPAHVIPSGSVSSLEEVEGKIALQPLIAGEILMQARFVDHAAGSTLAAMIEPKMRAVSLRVNDVVGVAGFLLPGNRVDVLATRKVNRLAETRTILRDIKVLAVDQTAATDKNEPVVVRAVTLEMTPAQAEELVKGQQEGTIQLTLRNPTEEEVVPEPVKQPVAAVKKSRPATRRAPQTAVTVIRGTEVETTKVRL